MPATTEYGSSTTLYLVSHDTGEWHTFATFDYTGSSPNGTLFGPTVDPLVVPGTYDLYYCHNCSISTTSTNIAYETDATDAFPNGLRVLQSGVVVGPGPTHLDVDIPVVATTAIVTLGGQPLPSSTEYGSSTSLYLVAKDTGQWHTLATFDYTGSSPNGTLFGPTVTPRMVPGTYDVYYCHNCALAGSSAPIAYETDATDAFPNGLRVLKANVVVGAGSANLAIDIPLAHTSATVTLGGQPLPATTEYGSSTSLYLVSIDTGQWHTFATFDYTGSSPNGTLFGPTVNPLVVPGTYDLYYCHNCSTSTTATNIAYETDATDAFPNGLRVLQAGVVIGSGPTHLDVDIPVTQTTGTVTLAGLPLPATTEYGSSTSIYLVAKDTGQWHTFATFDYTGSSPNGTLFGPTITPRVVPGTYDLLYCHNCALKGSTAPIAYETDATDAFPNGLRVLTSNVVIGSGPMNLAVDIPVATTSATITLAGQPLPATTEYGSSTSIYLVANDTGEWHTFATFDYTGSSPNGTLFGPTVSPRVVPGTYDLYYCHNCSTSTTSTNIAYETDVTDAFPNGLRILQAGVAIGAGTTKVAIDIPVVPLTEAVTLGGQPLPKTTEYGSSTTLYLVARDTGQWHTVATFDYTGSSPNGTLFGPTVDPRAMPGAYDVYYCHNCALTGKTAPIAYETDGTDAYPNGLRLLRSCVSIP